MVQDRVRERAACSNRPYYAMEGVLYHSTVLSKNVTLLMYKQCKDDVTM